MARKGPVGKISDASKATRNQAGSARVKAQLSRVLKRGKGDIPRLQTALVSVGMVGGPEPKASPQIPPPQRGRPDVEGRVQGQGQRRIRLIPSSLSEHGEKPSKLREKRTATLSEGQTKQALLIERLRRTKGATLAELVKAVGWQPHSVRGVLSRTGKIPGLKIVSESQGSRGRVYRLVGRT